MKRLIKAVRNNPAKWIILATFSLLLFWAMYQDLESTFPRYLIVLCWISGLFFGSLAIVWVIDPTLKYLDTKLEAVFSFKKNSP